MSNFHKKRTPPKRFCASCGTYVGRTFRDFVLCDPCKAEGLAEADRRTQERRERNRL